MNNLSPKILHTKILHTIDKYSLISSGETLVLAVSGGYDSLAMLHAFCKIAPIRNWKIKVAHLNHSLRKEADSDELHLKELCKQLNVEFYSKKVDVESYANEHKISFETAGRKLRYEFFDEIDCEKIATAHNANDNAESIIMHMLRGSGIKGLCGIRPKVGKIIRPLIECNRDEIEKFCDSNNYSPLIDVTNFSDDYFRNDIRHNIMPVLYEKSALSTFNNLSCVVSVEDEYIKYETEKAKNMLMKNNEIKLIDFQNLHLAIRRRLVREMFSECSFTQVNSVIKMCDKGVGNKVAQLTGGTVKLKNRSVIFNVK